MKLNARRIIAFLLLIALSVGFGFAYDGIATAVERHRYPLPSSVAPLIAQNAAEFGVPESILWATVRTQSNFSSNAVAEDGAVGLMQITPTEFSMICTTVLGVNAPESGMLYDPATNLRCGAAWLSYLYERYGVWETAYAAYHAGTDAVDAWLASPETVSPQGTLHNIPDGEAAAYVREMTKTVQMYSKLYYQS